MSEHTYFKCDWSGENFSRMSSVITFKLGEGNMDVEYAGKRVHVSSDEIERWRKLQVSLRDSFVRLAKEHGYSVRTLSKDVGPLDFGRSAPSERPEREQEDEGDLRGRWAPKRGRAYNPSDGYYSPQPAD